MYFYSFYIFKPNIYIQFYEYKIPYSHSVSIISDSQLQICGKHLKFTNIKFNILNINKS